MKLFGYQMDLKITKIPKEKKKSNADVAEGIFFDIEYRYESGPYKEKKYYEASPEVFLEVKRLAREDYLEYKNEDDLDDDELEVYHNPEKSFYHFNIAEKKPNGNIIFTV